MRGQVRETGGGVYSVTLDDGRSVEASLRGRLKLEARAGDQVVIGDWVEVALQDDHWVVESVEPRKTEIVRTRFGGRTVKALAANVDRLLIVMATAEPSPNRETIDRLLVVAESAGVEPILVINKIDLDGTGSVADGLEGAYGGIGYRVLRTTAKDREGIEELVGIVCEGISALAGPSGVGKSTLVNVIEPGLELRTAAVSRKGRRGRHTTVSSRLVPIECGGLIADTPGFSDVGVWGVAPESLSECFPEFRSHLPHCRFRGCSHLHEPDCAVLSALEAGEISHARYSSYRKLREEAEEQLARERGHT